MDEKENLHETPTVAGKTPGPQQLSDSGFPILEWDKYQFLDLIGQGGMGRVYKAIDPKLQRAVALKFIRGEDPELQQRFLREAQAQARVEHENVCKVYEVGEVEGKLYISMQFVQGLTLDKAAAEMSLEQKVKVMKEVAEGVHAAHTLGLIHRDIKPGNIIVERKEDGWHPYVMDFGLVREMQAQGVTVTGAMVGTPGYMSPEQAWGEKQLDRRSDVYSLGATLYELFSGQNPYAATTTMEVLKKLLNEEPISLRKNMKSIPEDLDTIVMKCLEREPQQRYDSARALAEDLQRYLEGEPIQARPPSVMYRWTKKARKNKALVGVTMVAFLLICALAIWSIRQQLQSRERAQLAQRFGQQIEQMDAILRTAYAIPLHDMRPEKRMVREQMKQIETQMKMLGQITEGPGNYALGRGYLTLNENEKAEEHLQKAWIGGYQEPQVAYARGLALGRIYEKELELAQTIQNQNERERRLRKIEAQYRNPAVQFLERSRDAQTSAPEYVEGLIAFYEKRYDEALKKAQASFQKLPWLYEAKILEGDVHINYGIDKRDRGDYPGAALDFDRAQQLYDTAIRVGESDWRAYAVLCNVWLARLQLELYGAGGDLSIPLEKAVQACDLALQADPDQAEIYTKQSMAYRMMAEDQFNRGQDITESVAKAEEASRKTIELNPKSDFAYSNLGTAQELRAMSEMYAGKDPRPTLQLAIANLQKALALNPIDSYTLNILTVSYQDQGIYEFSNGIDATDSFKKAFEYGKKAIGMNPNNASATINTASASNYLGLIAGSHGEDPTAAFGEGIALLKRALEINPNSVYAMNNLGGMLNARGDYERGRGRDPQKFYQEAIEILLKGTKTNPDDAFLYFNLRDSYRNLAEWQTQNRENPFSALALCEEYYHEGIRRNPGLAGVYSDQAIARIIQARWELDEGRNPLPTIRDGRNLIEKALKLDPNKATAFQHRGEMDLLEGLWKMRGGGNPESHFRSSKQALLKSAELNANDPETQLRLAELLRWHAEWLSKKNLDATVLVAEGLAATQKATQIKPDLGEAYAVQGALLRLQGKDPKEVFFRAFEINPNLRNRYS